MARRRKRREDAYGRLVALSALAFLAVAGVIAIIVAGNGTSRAAEGSMKAAISASAVIIRDEVSMTVEKFDHIVYEVNEGAQVNAEMPVAVVYKWGYSDDVTQSLLDIQQQIYDKQVAIMDGVESAELTSLNTQISDVQQRIRGSISGNNQENLLTLENNLITLLGQRITLLKNSVQADAELTALYAEEVTKQAQIAEYTSEVSVKSTGIVSFYFDGYEDVLSVDKLDVVNADLVNRIAGGADGSTVAISENGLYRLVNPDRWYAAFVSSTSDPLVLAEGESYSVVFEGYPNTVYTGKAVKSTASDSKVLNMFEFNENIGELIDVRTAKATITAELTGFKVAVSAINTKNGVSTVKSAETGENVEVRVLAIENDLALVRAVDGSSVYAGMRYKKG